MNRSIGKNSFTIIPILLSIILLNSFGEKWHSNEYIDVQKTSVPEYDALKIAAYNQRVPVEFVEGPNTEIEALMIEEQSKTQVLLATQLTGENLRNTVAPADHIRLSNLD